MNRASRRKKSFPPNENCDIDDQHFHGNNLRFADVQRLENTGRNFVSEDRDTIFKRYIERSTFGRVHKLLSLLSEAIFLDLVNGGVVSFRPFNETSSFRND